MLLVDEVLAVGDEGFTHKCLDKFAEFKRRNKTILLVTHSLNLVERFCDEALWLDGGRAMAHGDPKRVVGAYLTKVEEGEEELLAHDDGAARSKRAASRPAAATGRTGGDRHGAARRSDLEHVSGDRRALGLARGRDHRRRVVSTATGSRRSCFTPAIRCRSA